MNNSIIINVSQYAKYYIKHSISTHEKLLDTLGDTEADTDWIVKMIQDLKSELSILEKNDDFYIMTK